MDGSRPVECAADVAYYILLQRALVIDHSLRYISAVSGRSCISNGLPRQDSVRLHQRACLLQVAGSVLVLTVSVCRTLCGVGALPGRRRLTVWVSCC